MLDQKQVVNSYLLASLVEFEEKGTAEALYQGIIDKELLPYLRQLTENYSLN